MRVITLHLPSADSKSSQLKSSKVSPKYFAARVSFLGGLAVSIWIRSLRRFVTSSLISLNN